MTATAEAGVIATRQSVPVDPGGAAWADSELWGVCTAVGSLPVGGNHTAAVGN